MAILTKNRGRFFENLSRIFFMGKSEEIQYLFSRKFRFCAKMHENLYARKFLRIKGISIISISFLLSRNGCTTNVVWIFKHSERINGHHLLRALETSSQVDWWNDERNGVELFPLVHQISCVVLHGEPTICSTHQV